MTLSDYMDAHGISLRQLAIAADVSPSTISRHVRGQVIASTLTLEKLSLATGGQVSVETLWHTGFNARKANQ